MLSAALGASVPLDRVDTSRLIITDPNYVHRLSGILNGVTKHTLASFLIWRLVEAKAEFLDGEALPVRTSPQ